MFQDRGSAPDPGSVACGAPTPHAAPSPLDFARGDPEPVEGRRRAVCALTVTRPPEHERTPAPEQYECHRRPRRMPTKFQRFRWYPTWFTEAITAHQVTITKSRSSFTFSRGPTPARPSTLLRTTLSPVEG